MDEQPVLINSTRAKSMADIFLTVPPPDLIRYQEFNEVLIIITGIKKPLNVSRGLLVV